jgi:GEVED domain
LSCEVEFRSICLVLAPSVCENENRSSFHNTSGHAVILYAWIDFDKDGKFGVGEFQSISVANNATTASLSWALPSGTNSGSTYARFRLTNDMLTDNIMTTELDERSLMPMMVK